MEKTIVNVLLVEDNPVDQRLARNALAHGPVPCRLNVASDGAEALAFLRHEKPHADAPKPDLVLLDLNLPKASGRDILTALKNDPNLRRIPVIILTTSQDPQDIFDVYNLHANSYITKPVDVEKFRAALDVLQAYWFGIVQLPLE